MANLLGIGGEFLAVDRCLLGLEPAQPSVHIAQLQLCFAQVARQLFDLPAQAGVLGARQFELVVGVKQAAAQLTDLIEQLRVLLVLLLALLLLRLLALFLSLELVLLLVLLLLHQPVQLLLLVLVLRLVRLHQLT